MKARAELLAKRRAAKPAAAGKGAKPKALRSVRAPPLGWRARGGLYVSPACMRGMLGVGCGCVQCASKPRHRACPLLLISRHGWWVHTGRRADPSSSRLAMWGYVHVCQPFGSPCCSAPPPRSHASSRCLASPLMPPPSPFPSDRHQVLQVDAHRVAVRGRGLRQLRGVAAGQPAGGRGGGVEGRGAGIAREGGAGGTHAARPPSHRAITHGGAPQGRT